MAATYRASGQKSRAWAQANDVPARVLVSWCAHSRRWQARLEGVDEAPARQPKSKGFVVARAAPGSAAATVLDALDDGAVTIDF